MPGAREAFAEVGQEGTPGCVNVSALFGKGVGLDIALDVATKTALADVFIKLGVVGRVVQMGRDPFDTEESIWGIAVVSASWRVNQVIDYTFDVIPEVGVRVGFRGTGAVEDFTEVSDNSFVVGAYENRMDGVSDHVGDGTKLSAVSAGRISLQRLSGVGGGLRGDKNSPTRSGKQRVQRVNGRPVSEHLNEVGAVNGFEVDVGDAFMNEKIGVRLRVEEGVPAIVAWGQLLVELRVVRADASNLESAVVAYLLELVGA